MSGKDSRRGRPVGFDEAAVVEVALDVFWRRGYAASLRELEAATGVDRSTIYNSFGGKRGLYERAAHRYVDLLEAELFVHLQVGAEPFLERLAAQIGNAEGPRGCLIVNELATGSASPSASGRYLDSLTSRATRALGAPELATLLVSAVVGINQIAVTSPERALAMIGGVRAFLRARAASAPPASPRAGSAGAREDPD